MTTSGPRPLPGRPESVAPRPLRELVDRLGDAVSLSADGSVAGVEVTGVTLDSRAVRPGDLYAALPGAHAHGAAFAADALRAGAVAVLTDAEGAEAVARVPVGVPVLVVDAPRRHVGRAAVWAYGDPAASMTLIGITGTNGKTTTAYLLEAGLRAAGHTTGLLGTVETRVGDLVVPSVRTTPEAPDLQALLAVMRERGVDAAAMEVSSHALALGRVDGTRYAAAVFTNLSQDHLDFHPDMEAYFAAKALLFTPARADLAVINLDDPAGERLLHKTRLPVTTTSARGDARADWRAVDVVATRDGSTFRLLGPAGEDLPAGVRLAGTYNVDNALSAVAALVSTGTDVATAVAGVAGLAGVPGRVERVDAGQPWLAVVDYAHTPDAVTAVLAALRPSTGPGGRLLVVLGCGGDRDRAKRPLMGAAAVAGADLAILTSDNPRSEDPAGILAEMASGADARGSAYLVVEERAAAIAAAVARARPGDVVVVAGKGHEQGQEVAGRVIPFDDRTVLRAAITAAVGAGRTVDA